MFRQINDYFKKKISKPLLIISFFLFLIILIWITLFKANKIDTIKDLAFVQANSNIVERLSDFFYFYIDHQVILNIVIFIPIGIYLSFFSKKKNYLLIGFFGFLISMFIELIQLFFGFGSIELIDLITNTMGCIIGLLIYYYLFRKVNFLTINYINCVILLIFTPFCIFIIVKTSLLYEYYIPFFDGTTIKNLFNFNKAPLPFAY